MGRRILVTHFIRSIKWYGIYCRNPQTHSLSHRVRDIFSEPSWGTLTAIDTRNQGHIQWQIKTELPLIGGVLATAGNLLFMGEGSGMFTAFDSQNGKRLWEFNCGAGVNAPPMSYKVGNQQYIAVAAGGHGLLKTPSGNALISFGLSE